MLWHVVACCGMLWHVVACCGMLWHVLACCCTCLSGFSHIAGVCVCVCMCVYVCVCVFARGDTQQVLSPLIESFGRWRVCVRVCVSIILFLGSEKIFLGYYKFGLVKRCNFQLF